MVVDLTYLKHSILEGQFGIVLCEDSKFKDVDLLFAEGYALINKIGH